MGINHGDGHIHMPQQFLHRADILTDFEQMRGEDMGRNGICLRATAECRQAGDTLPKRRLKIPLTLIADPVTIAFIATTNDVVRVKLPVSALQSP